MKAASGVHSCVAECFFSAPPGHQFVPELAILSSCECMCVFVFIYALCVGCYLKIAHYVDEEKRAELITLGDHIEELGLEIRGKNQQSKNVRYFEVRTPMISLSLPLSQ